MGTYSDEAPGASVAERLANSLSKIVGLPTKSKRAPITGTDSSGQPATAAEAADSQSSDSSKLGRMKQAQSTDRDNSYSY